jgi:hypothetical protein
MNTSPDPLEPLFRWSRAAPQPQPPDAPPPGFATRVLAQLRPPPERDWLLWLLPRFVTVAVLLTMAAWLPRYSAETEPPEAELAAGIFETSLPPSP